MTFPYEGMRILLTQSSLVHVAGSEVQVLELAEYLHEQGAEVILYTWLYDEVMLRFFEEIGIEVIQASEQKASSLSLREFDIIWIQHEVIPLNFFEELKVINENKEAQSSRAKMIFSHMSPFREIHLEYPYHLGLEDVLSDVIVFNSEETKSAQQKFYAPSDRFALYPNPVPAEFSQLETAESGLKKILVVSNHPPREVEKAAEILRRRGIEVKQLSDTSQEKKQIINAHLLQEFDCVISIGKTVQASLVSGIPVYVYDHFGGEGYLTEENLGTAEYFNFSGRKSNISNSLVLEKQISTLLRKSGQQIADEIVSGFEEALTFQGANRATFIKKYSIDSVIETVFSQALDSNKNIEIDFDMLDKWAATQQMIMDYQRSLIELSEPERVFYKQPITLYKSQTGQISANDLIVTGATVSRHTELDIDMESCDTLRLDFGELPCYIENFTLQESTPLTFEISSDAILTEGSTFLFPFDDPKIFVRFMDPQPRSVSLHVACDILPLSAVTDEMIEELAHHQRQIEADVINLRNQLNDILNSKWWRLGERLRTILGR